MIMSKEVRGVLPVEGPNQEGFCWPRCAWFKCGKIIAGRPAIRYRGRNVWCTWINDACVGPRCSFALCVRGKMMSDGKCGLLVRRITRETIKPDDFKLDLKVKGRMAKRLGPLDEIV
jgi:hypothetical protein